MARNDWKARLKALDPCPKAYRWAVKHKTLRQAWRMCEDYEWMEWLLRECDWDEVVDAVEETMQWEWEDYPAFSFREETLQDAYICLDFMPDPPELPELP